MERKILSIQVTHLIQPIQPYLSPTTIGSGLTHKQRSLVIIIIVLLCYVSLGSLAQTRMLKISFIDALYFSVLSIETIGI